MTPTLSLDSVACQRGGRLLFHGVSLSLRAGDASLVRGPNGVGKSSLLRLIAGLLTPFSGTVSAAGKLALADEALALDTRLPLSDALSFWSRIDQDTPVASALDSMGIAHFADVPVRILSTGQRKRAVLARTIASAAQIWLLDEPANGLDIASLDRLSAVMAAHRAKGGIVVAASHQPLDLPDAQSLTLVS